MAEANNKVPITKKHRQAPAGNGETPEGLVREVLGPEIS